MKATINYKEKKYSVYFNPEDLAGQFNFEGITSIIAKKASPLENVKEEELTLESVDGIVSERFFRLFTSLNTNWMIGKEKIQKKKKPFFGKETYWTIDNLFSIIEKGINDEDYLDFRTAIVSGNCFLTKEEAEEFKNKILSLALSFSESEPKVLQKDNNNESNYPDRRNTCNSEKNYPNMYYIDFLDKEEYKLWKKTGDPPYYPGRVYYGIANGPYQFPQQLSPESICFISPDTATIICILIADMFDNRGVVFKGIDMESNTMEYEQED